MVLEKYSKAQLKQIVEIYNLGLDEKSLKKKKAELVKEMMKAGKKKFDEADIDKKLEKKETLTAEKKKKPKLKINSKKKKEDPKQPKIKDALKKK